MLTAAKHMTGKIYSDSALVEETLLALEHSFTAAFLDYKVFRSI